MAKITKQNYYSQLFTVWRLKKDLEAKYQPVLKCADVSDMNIKHSPSHNAVLQFKNKIIIKTFIITP
jgi:hypothetical protein